MAINDHKWGYTMVYGIPHFQTYPYTSKHVLFRGFDLKPGRSMTPGSQKERFLQNQRRTRQLWCGGNQLFSEIVAVFN
jgi:hypothetical protein